MSKNITHLPCKSPDCNDLSHVCCGNIHVVKITSTAIEKITCFSCLDSVLLYPKALGWEQEIPEIKVQLRLLKKCNTINRLMESDLIIQKSTPEELDKFSGLIQENTLTKLEWLSYTGLSEAEYNSLLKE